MSCSDYLDKLFYLVDILKSKECRIGEHLRQKTECFKTNDFRYVDELLRKGVIIIFSKRTKTF